MVDYSLALLEIEKFTKVFKAFEESKNALTALASLDQATKEIQKRKDSLEKECQEEKLLFDSFKKQVKEDTTKLLTFFEKQQKTLEEEYTEGRVKLEEEFLKRKVNIQNILEESSATLEESLLKNKVLTKEIKKKQEEIASLEQKMATIKTSISSLLK